MVSRYSCCETASTDARISSSSQSFRPGGGHGHGGGGGWVGVSHRTAPQPKTRLQNPNRGQNSNFGPNSSKFAPKFAPKFGDSGRKRGNLAPFPKAAAKAPVGRKVARNSGANRNLPPGSGRSGAAGSGRTPKPAATPREFAPKRGFGDKTPQIPPGISKILREIQNPASMCNNPGKNLRFAAKRRELPLRFGKSAAKLKRWRKILRNWGKTLKFGTKPRKLGARHQIQNSAEIFPKSGRNSRFGARVWKFVPKLPRFGGKFEIRGKFLNLAKNLAQLF